MAAALAVGALLVIGATLALGALLALGVPLVCSLRAGRRLRWRARRSACAGRRGEDHGGEPEAEAGSQRSFAHGEVLPFGLITKIVSLLLGALLAEGLLDGADDTAGGTLGVTVGTPVSVGALVGCTVAVDFGDAPASA